jgi:hypothetical protein
MGEVENCDEEEAVRSMLYHEVSHAILTPAEALNNSYQVNVFEDERIETVLRHYYHNVDFRKQLYDLHGGCPPKAVDAKSAYFNAVRFGLGTPKVQREVNRIIQDYRRIHRASKRWDDDGPSVGYYEDEINDLYNLIKKEWAADPEAFQPKNGEGKSGSSMDELQYGEGKGATKGEGDGKEEGADSEMSNEPYYGEPHESELTSDDVKKMVGASLGGHPDLSKAEIEKLNDFQEVAERIIGNFNKKNKGGSGINTYSGVFNPRAVARGDYRFFERSMTTQGNNKFGSCHLNLIIDRSGSFCENAPLTNGILQVLSAIERKNRNFTMDVAFINHEFHICKSVRERILVADGGNSVPENMKDILVRMQKPQTCNYNIVLFDGDAICNWRGSDKENCRLFRAFDMKQLTLITDPDNEQYMKPSFTSAKVVVTHNYTAELIDHIIHALTIAFA